MALLLLLQSGKQSEKHCSQLDLCPAPKVVMLLGIAAALETSLVAFPPWNDLHVDVLSLVEAAAH